MNVNIKNIRSISRFIAVVMATSISILALLTCLCEPEMVLALVSSTPVFALLCVAIGASVGFITGYLKSLSKSAKIMGKMKNRLNSYSEKMKDYAELQAAYAKLLDKYNALKEQKHQEGFKKFARTSIVEFPTDAPQDSAVGES